MRALQDRKCGILIWADTCRRNTAPMSIRQRNFSGLHASEGYCHLLCGKQGGHVGNASKAGTVGMGELGAGELRMWPVDVTKSCLMC